MIHFMFLVSRQGKVRLTKWYGAFTTTEKSRYMREVSTAVLNRPPRNCNVIEWRDRKLIYKRYASLYFVACVDSTDNELITLEVIHHFVEVLDRYFGNVCELDIIFNFHKAYYLLDEVLLGGHLQEANKLTILEACASQDAMMEESKDAARS